jgi:hypothetical protein
MRISLMPIEEIRIGSPQVNQNHTNESESRRMISHQSGQPDILTITTFKDLITDCRKGVSSVDSGAARS